MGRWRGFAGRTGRTVRLASSHDDRHALQVVGEDPKPYPGPGAVQAAQPGAPQPERALEVADARLDPHAPVAHPFERPGLLQLAAGPAGRAGALQPDAPHAELGEGVVGVGEPEAAV